MYRRRLLIYTEELELFCRVDLFLKETEHQHNIENGSCRPESNVYYNRQLLRTKYCFSNIVLQYLTLFLSLRTNNVMVLLIAIFTS